jgi:hypothetical protein
VIKRMLVEQVHVVESHEDVVEYALHREMGVRP